MKQGQSKPDGLGFYTVLELAGGNGYSGGLLVLTPTGRPLEFHCTAPVKPNRAQEILYGPTLQPFLYGDHIGRTLIEKAKISLSAIFTDLSDAESLRGFIKVPMLLVGAHAGSEKVTNQQAQPTAALNSGPTSEGRSATDKTWRRDAAHDSLKAVSMSWSSIESSKHELSISNQFLEDRQAFSSSLEPQLHLADLNEPFDRIREAIAEAMQQGR